MWPLEPPLIYAKNFKVMETKIALLVVYNHRYDKNISLINSIYKNKFTYIYHLVPFYDGNLDNVITVYDSSYYFHNYIAQAYQHLKSLEYTHFFIIADDMILNPAINEKNLWQNLNITKNDCYISSFIFLQTRTYFWPWITNALKYKRLQPGVEIMDILPTKEEAINKFKKHGFPVGKIPLKRVLTKRLYLFYYCVLKKLPFSLVLDYPLIGGYSDIFITTAKEMPRFCQILGAFAATKLFVEIAIPTALVLTAETIKTDDEVLLKRGDIWLQDRQLFENNYNNSLSKLLNDFPLDKLYVHPVKLSRWKK